MRIGITGLALMAAVALSFSATVAPAAAASGGIMAKTTQQASGDELSAAKRHRARVYRHYRGNAGAAQAFGAIAGTIGGIVAAEQARRYYYRPYPYGYGYGYAAPYGGYYGRPYGGYGYYGY